VVLILWLVRDAASFGHSMKTWMRQMNVLVVLGMLTQCAAPGLHADREAFRAADANGDGKLSLAEAEAFEYRRIFDSVDLDGDGVVTLQEAKEISPDFTLAKFREYDLNRDGKVTYAEFEKVQKAKGDVKKRFLAADLDGDGFVTKKEADTRVKFLRDYAGGSM
jgi:Ca2+-binding EF-hand superfamily protein